MIIHKPLETCTSTNDEARKFIDRFSPGPDWNPDSVIVANKQTAGKTTKPTSWWSPEDAGIYLSVIRTIPKQNLDLFTTLVGYALTSALRRYTLLDIQQRGVNDLFLDNRKLAGILCEIYKEHLIVGVGLNVFQPNKIRHDLIGKSIWLNEFASELLLDKNVLIKLIVEAILK
jgi:BirA family transcriptional regulator, biotin operon repressor / biotin---[acetyl-CoA-carboxylase] ligase